MAKQLNTGTLKSHPPTIIMVGSGSRQTHGAIGCHRGKEGVSIVGRMGRKAADGAVWMAKQLNTGTIKGHPPTIIMVGSGRRQHIRSGAGVDRRTGTESLEEWWIEQRREPRDRNSN